MTTKELCDALRHTHPSRTMCKHAADEIERLAALAQSGVELKAVLPSDAFTDLATKLVTVCLQNIEQKMPYDLMVGEVAATLASVAQSDTEPVRIVHDDAFGWGVLLNGKPVKCLFNSKEKTVAWLAAAIAHPDDIRD
jgi:hypothetical protein